MCDRKSFARVVETRLVIELEIRRRDKLSLLVDQSSFNGHVFQVGAYWHTVLVSSSSFMSLLVIPTSHPSHNVDVHFR